LLRRETGHPRTRTAGQLGGQRRFDPPHDLLDDLRQLTASPIVMPSTNTPPHRRERQRNVEGGQVVAWLFALLGAAVLGGGIGLIAWSLLESRIEFWNVAVGLTLTGQGLLIFGLVMISTRLWRNSRYATTKLQDVHVDVAKLRQTTDALAASRSGGAPAFYADLVRGASPQMLLANLKGQLDQLTTRLGA
jgi:hypothetical protein